MNDKIGQCVFVLFYKLWSKTLIKNRLQSEVWWKERLKRLKNVHCVIIPEAENTQPGMYDANGNFALFPKRYEDENPEYASLLYQIFKEKKVFRCVLTKRI